MSENVSNESVDEINNQYHEELLKNQDAESIVENTSNEKEISFSQEAVEMPNNEDEISNNLKEFGVDVETPDLFNSDQNQENHQDLLQSSKDEMEEDDLEIPAFLRRQKN